MMFCFSLLKRESAKEGVLGREIYLKRVCNGKCVGKRDLLFLKKSVIKTFLTVNRLWFEEVKL